MRTVSRRVIVTCALSLSLAAAWGASPLLGGAAASKVIFTNGPTLSRIAPTGGRSHVIYHAPSPGRLSSASAAAGGRRIAFLLSRREDGSHLQVVHQFTDLGLQTLDVSDAGERLVFDRQHSVASSTTEVWTIRSNGRGLHRVAVGGEPQFAPGGDRIVFVEDDGIFGARLAGGRRHLIRAARGAGGPAYSPNGDQIAFSKAGPGNLYRLWVMDSNGRHAHNVVHGDSQQFNPDFAPSGRFLVYWNEVFNPFDTGIFTVRLDGSHQKLLSPKGDDPEWTR
jgi:dipeptidyl aminopeptidase/acylaminoacyl peptidase